MLCLLLSTAKQDRERSPLGRALEGLGVLGGLGGWAGLAMAIRALPRDVRGSARQVSGDTEAQHCPFRFLPSQAPRMSSAISPRPPAAELRPHLSHGPQPCFFSFYQLLPRITPLWWSGLSHAPPGRGWVGSGTRRHRMVTARSKMPAFPPLWLLRAAAPCLRGCTLQAQM